MKRYTYRTQKEINAALEAMGSPCVYVALIAGIADFRGTGHTLLSAKTEVDMHFKQCGREGMVVDTRTGEIVYVASMIQAPFDEVGALKGITFGKGKER